MIRVIRETGQVRNRKGMFGWRVEGLPLSGVSSEPLLDACRAIKRMGGVEAHRQIALYREGRDRPDAICGLEWGATHTVREDRKSGPVFIRWRPHPGKAAFVHEAVA